MTNYNRETIFASHIIDDRVTSLKCKLLLKIHKEKKSQQPNLKNGQRNGCYFEKGNKNESLPNKKLLMLLHSK